MRTSTASSIHTPIFISGEEEEGANDVIAKAPQYKGKVAMKYRRALVLPKIPRIMGKHWCAKIYLKHNSESEDVGLYGLKTF